MLLCPSILETLSIGTPFVKVTVVANVARLQPTLTSLDYSKLSN